MSFSNLVKNSLKVFWICFPISGVNKKQLLDFCMLSPLKLKGGMSKELVSLCKVFTIQWGLSAKVREHAAGRLLRALMDNRALRGWSIREALWRREHLQSL